MSLTGATGYDSVVGASAPSSSLTDFSLLVSFVPSASWWAAYSAAGKIRVTDSTGTTEYARDVLGTPSSSLVILRIKWAGAQTGTPSLRVYPNATDSYAASDTYGQYAAYDSNWKGYWPCEESSTAIVDRISGITGTATGSTVAFGSTGKVGSGVTLSGSGRFELGAVASLNITSNLSLLLWTKPTSLGSSQTIIECSDVSGSPFNGYELRVDTDNSKLAYYSNNAGRKASNASMIANGTWVHAAVTADGTNDNFFKNGSGWGSVAASGSPSSFTGNRAIGSRPGGVFPYAGVLDDVQIHSAARSSAWIGYEYTITNDAASFWSNSGWTALSTGSPWYYNAQQRSAA
jgi:hypothetical protein